MNLLIYTPRSDSNVLYRRLRTVYKDMISRCTNPNCSSYSMYGGRGVTVDPEWDTLDGFLSTVDYIEGWDLNNYLDGGLVLDKDIKSQGDKVYSVATCKWVSMEENTQYQGLTSIYGISPTGNVILTDSTRRLAEILEVSQSTVSESYRLNRPMKNGWRVFRETLPETLEFVRVRVDGKEFVSHTIATVLNVMDQDGVKATRKTISYGLNSNYGKPARRSGIQADKVLITRDSLTKCLTTIESSTSAEKAQGIISDLSITKRVEYTPISVETVGGSE